MSVADERKFDILAQCINGKFVFTIADSSGKEEPVSGGPFPDSETLSFELQNRHVDKVTADNVARETSKQGSFKIPAISIPALAKIQAREALAKPHRGGAPISSDKNVT